MATAYQLLERLPGAKVTVLEKESSVGQHQSGHNSGVLHCGLYYRPGSRRARLAVKGVRQMVEFCRTHSIRHEVCGKVVVATSQDEVPRLNALFQRGQENGLRGLKLLSSEELREIEPHAAGLAAIRVPEEGIADYPRVCEVLLEQIRSKGGEVKTGARVTGIVKDAGGWRVVHSAGEHASDWILTCAGLYSDRVAALTGRPRSVRIVPFRGEYYLIRPERQFLARNLIYPVPDPAFPFLGVHFTRMIRGGVEAGPNAVLAYAREGYTKSEISVGDLARMRLGFRACGVSCAATPGRVGRSCGDLSANSYSAAPSNGWCRRSASKIFCREARESARRRCRRMERYWTILFSSRANARFT